MQKRLKTQGKLPADKMKFIKEGTERIKVIDNTVEEETEEYEKIDEEMRRTSDGGKIRVESIAYPGVKIVISNMTSFIHTETQHCTFVREGADIRIKTLLKKKFYKAERGINVIDDYIIIPQNRRKFHRFNSRSI